MTENTVENNGNDVPFCPFLSFSVALDFLNMQDKHNFRQSIAFLPVSNACEFFFYIFSTMDYCHDITELFFVESGVEHHNPLTPLYGEYIAPYTIDKDNSGKV